MRFLFRALMFFAILTIPLIAAEIKVPVSFDTLKNGLRIIVVPDTNVAVVSCRLYYFVGSMYEHPGYTGLSHMYEHMMFKGTRRLGTTNCTAEVPIMAAIDSIDNLYIRKLQDTGADSITESYHRQMGALLEKQRAYIKKDEIWELYQNNGATNLNAWTADDMTAYIVTLPKNKIELFYWIESDRMRNPVLREFVSERDVVMEERRMRYDNKPIGRYWERLNALFYVASPFRNPTIGWASDIQGFTRKKLEDHVHKFYTPDNALIVLVGNIDPKTAKKGIERYFGAISRAAKPKEEVITREPKPIGETRFTVRDDAAPRIDMLFHTPGYPSDVLYKLDVVEAVFSGRSGRLYHRLVDKEGLCTSAGAGNGIQLFDSYFTVWAQMKNDADPARVEAIIREELAALAATPPSPAEMMRVQNEIRMAFVSNLTNLEGISDKLAWFERLRSWQDMLEFPKHIAEVNREEIPAVVREYLDPARMTIGLLLQNPADNKKASGATKN
jgi:predicted Zn-dependent peptidase